MSRAVAFADRLAPLAFRLVLAAHVLLFLSFFALLLATAGAARAEAPACTGEDMLAQLRAADLGKAQAIAAEADAVPNGQGLLWKLEKPGRRPSWLFGTMHVTDPRVLDLSPAAQAAFDAAGTLVIETTDVLDEAGMLAAIAAEPELMMFTDGTTLESLLSQQDAKILEAGLEARGIPPGSVSRMKPWMLSAMVALPACEIARKAGGAAVLDVRLAHEAQAAGKAVTGLETANEQLRAMASLPIELHMRGLVEALKLGQRMDDVVETMVVLYEAEATGMFWPLFRAVLPGAEDDEAGYVAFEQALITGRNRTMAERAAPILDDGNAFLAVGAMHLPGKDGLVALLREAGFTVTVLP